MRAVKNRVNPVEAHPHPRPSALGNHRARRDEESFDIGPSDIRPYRIGENRFESAAVPPSHPSSYQTPG
jgi:hypothetical protein